MSRIARIMLGIALLVIALGFSAVAWFSLGTDLPIAKPMIGMGAASAIGAVACLRVLWQPTKIRSSSSGEMTRPGNDLQGMGQFDLTRLNGFGWLLLLGTFAVCIAGAFAAAFMMKDTRDEAEWRLVRRQIALVLFGGGLGFFFGCRRLLERVGISIYRR